MGFRRARFPLDHVSAVTDFLRPVSGSAHAKDSYLLDNSVTHTDVVTVAGVVFAVKRQAKALIRNAGDQIYKPQPILQRICVVQPLGK